MNVTEPHKDVKSHCRKRISIKAHEFHYSTSNVQHGDLVQPHKPKAGTVKVKQTSRKATEGSKLNIHK